MGNEVVKVQARHADEVKTFLGCLNSVGGSLKSTEVKASGSIKAICKNRGLAEVGSKGLGASWTITDAGKAYLAKAA